MNKTLIALAIFATFGAHAQDVVGDNSTFDKQTIGDQTTNVDRTNSSATQVGNSANQIGNGIDTKVDTRDQNTNNVSPTATGGAAIGNKSDIGIDNKSQVGPVNASNGDQTMGAVGSSRNDNSSKAAAAAINGGMQTSVGDTTSKATGGAGGAGGKGGAGGTAGALAGSLSTSAGGAGGTASGGAGGTATGGSAAGGTASGGTANGTNTSRNSVAGGNQATDIRANTDVRNAASGGNSRNAVQAGNGAGAGAGSGAGSGAGANNRTNLSTGPTQIDASDRSTSQGDRVNVWAPVIHATPAAPLAAANLVVVPGVCGPRVWVERVPVIGKRFGIFGGVSDVEQGYDDIIHPEKETFIRRDGYLLGSMVTEFRAVLGTSSGGSISIAGYGKDGQAGQGGASVSGQMQQIVGRVQVRECIMAEKKVEPTIVIQEVEVVRYVPQTVIEQPKIEVVKPRVYRKRKVCAPTK